MSLQRWSVVALVAVAAAFVLPAVPAQDQQPAPGDAASLTVLDRTHAWPAARGWHITSTTPASWVHAYYGSGATWERQQLIADHGRRAWDRFARPRTIVVDTLTADRAQALSDFPVSTTYPIAANRSRAPATVDLGHGVTGQLYDTVDDDRALTFTMLTLTWTVRTAAGTKAQRVTLLSSDDHRAGAYFPPAEPSLGESVRAALKRIVRGDATALDTNTQPKDASMLVSAARSLVTTVADGPAR